MLPTAYCERGRKGERRTTPKLLVFPPREGMWLPLPPRGGRRGRQRIWGEDRESDPSELGLTVSVQEERPSPVPPPSLSPLRIVGV